MCQTLGCPADHASITMRWRAALALAADAGDYTYTPDFPLQTPISGQVWRTNRAS